MNAAAKFVAIIIGLCLLVTCAIAGGAPAAASNDPSSVASSTIPGALLVLFQRASAASPCGVPWTLLAAVAHTESDFDPTAVSSAGAPPAMAHVTSRQRLMMIAAILAAAFTTAPCSS